MNDFPRVSEHIFLDLGYAVRFSVISDQWADWRIYDCSADDEKPTFHRRGAPSSIDRVASMDEADWELEGFVKWDGCMEFSTTDNHPHLCGRESLGKLLKTLDRIYDIAEEKMPSFDKETAS